MSVDALHPIAGKHAIQSAAFILQWPVPLERETLVGARALADQLRPWFSVVQEQKSITIEIAPTESGRQLAPLQQDDLAGVHFIQPNPALGPAGVTRALQLQRDQINIVVNDYTRWDEAWPKIENWLRILLPVILNGRPVSGVILQYNDIFEWRGNPADIVLSEIFRAESKYLNRDIFEAPNLWHLHQGVVFTRTDPVPHQLIENVNLSVSDINARRAISIFTSHHAILNTPLWELDVAKDKLAEVADDLHERNKDVIREVLTSAVCQKIGLV